MLGIKDVLKYAKTLNISNIGGLLKGDPKTVRSMIARKIASIKDPAARRKISYYINKTDRIAKSVPNRMMKGDDYSDIQSDLKNDIYNLKKELDSEISMYAKKCVQYVKANGIPRDMATTESVEFRNNINSIKIENMHEFIFKVADLKYNVNEFYEDDNAKENEPSISQYTLYAFLMRIFEVLRNMLNQVWRLIINNVTTALMITGGAIILGILTSPITTVSSIITAITSLMYVIQCSILLIVFISLVVPAIGLALLAIRERSKDRFDTFMTNLKDAYSKLSGNLELHHIVAFLINYVAIGVSVLLMVFATWSIAAHILPVLKISKFIYSGIINSVLTAVMIIITVIISVNIAFLYKTLSKIYGRNYFTFFSSITYDVIRDTVSAVSSLFFKITKSESKNNGNIEKTKKEVRDDIERTASYLDENNQHSDFQEQIADKVEDVEEDIPRIAACYKAMASTVKNYALI